MWRYHWNIKILQLRQRFGVQFGGNVEGKNSDCAKDILQICIRDICESIIKVV